MILPGPRFEVYIPRVMRAWWRDPGYPVRRFTLVALADLLDPS